MTGNALIVGAGSGLSASLARMLHSEGYKVALAARSTDKLADLASELNAQTFTCDASDPKSVEALFGSLDSAMGDLDVVIYNPSFRVRGPLVELDPADVFKALEVTAFGGFLVGQQAAKRMAERKSGAILFTGASASIKGYPQSAPFAMGKFALRGLAQSMARELQPQGIHVAHFVLDGGISSASRPNPDDAPDKFLDPDAIAQSYLHVIKQHRSTWTWEIELRPWVEGF